MERLHERIQSASKALNAFNEVMKIEEPSTIVRDAAIQRFEFSLRHAGKQASNICMMWKD